MRHTAYADMFLCDEATLGKALCRIEAGLNRYGHRVENIVFDDEVVFAAMKDVMAVQGVNCMLAPASLHGKRVERMV